MLNLTIIWTFSYQHQMLIIRGRLASEGIESFTQDETTIQVDPLFSNAIGGIKLLVHKEDAERALEVLAENGFVKKEDRQTEQILQWLYRFTGQLPILRTMAFERRVYVLTVTGVVLTAGILYILAR